MMSLQKLMERPVAWSKKAFVRAGLLLLAAALIAGVAASFGIAHDYGFLRVSLLSGTPGGEYYALATRLAARAKREHGVVNVVPTAGSVENIQRLSGGRRNCGEDFAFVQDGTPVSADAGLEVLGRLPDPESLFLLARQGRAISTFDDLRGASIGIGPEGSGTAYLMRELFSDRDLQALGVHLSAQDLSTQAERVGNGQLDIAAFVMNEDAPVLQSTIRQYGLEIVSPRDIEGLIARHPWLGLGRIPSGRYDLVRPTPATDKTVAQVATLVLANSCAHRAENCISHVAERGDCPGFVRSNPPRVTNAATDLPLASEARQFYLTGEPELADRYFPWLVDLLSPAYWIYLAMAATVLFNAMNAASRFRLWRLDSAREKIEAQLKQLTGADLTREQMRALPPEQVLASPGAREAARGLLEQLAKLRARCQRETASMITPMGQEMFYRYQESLIEDVATTLSILLRQPPGAAAAS